jgi:ubiquinone biosynthesis protein COQ4
MATTAAYIEFAPAPPVRVQWRRAWRAVRTLINEADRTEMAFEAIAAVSGRDFERVFQRVAASPEGRALLTERPSLLAVLSDRAALRALPPGTFGRAYADFMDETGLDPSGLVAADEACEAAMPRPASDPVRDWLGNRTRDAHDLWHVLTAYGRDEAGEAANLAFSYAQMPFRGIALILLAIVLLRPHGGRLRWPRYLHRAWRRGRAARDLLTVRYERLLPLPLADVRRMLNIAPAEETHPEGIIASAHVLAATHAC